MLLCTVCPAGMCPDNVGAICASKFLALYSTGPARASGAGMTFECDAPMLSSRPSAPDRVRGKLRPRAGTQDHALRAYCRRPWVPDTRYARSGMTFGTSPSASGLDSWLPLTLGASPRAGPEPLVMAKPCFAWTQAGRGRAARRAPQRACPEDPSLRELGRLLMDGWSGQARP